MTSEKPAYNTMVDRQKLAIGEEAQSLLKVSSVLISGINGLGVEIAKNAILMGIKQVAIHDTVNTTWMDLSTQYYLSEGDIGKNRALASLAKLTQLNPYVEVSAISTPLSAEVIKKFNCFVIVNATDDEALSLNEICRDNKIKFISTNSNGAFCRVFVDVGNEHVCTDRNGDKKKNAVIKMIDHVKTMGIMIDGSHTFTMGDYVSFSQVEGMTEVNTLPPSKVISSSAIGIQVEVDSSKFNKYTGNGYVSLAKVAFTITHKSLLNELQKPTFNMMMPPYTLHAAYASLSVFVSKHSRALPRPHNTEDTQEIVGLAKEIFAKMFPTKKFDERTAELFARTAAGAVAPVASIMGGLVSQEVMKLVTGKLTPLNQWLYIECMDIVPTPPPTEEDARPQGTRYDGQLAVIGRAAHARLVDLRLFLVGAGAIGCEHLKNLAQMGVATGPAGAVHVTDMDSIEVSNLSRQFLFRPTDVGHSKSECACRAIQQMNPAFRVHTYTVKVAPETESVFNDAFWGSLSFVANALDNVPSRKYVDGQCVIYKKPLLESGTLGTRCNTQVVIPYITETYADKANVKSDAVAVCTLKSIPYLIEHTIEYALNDFVTLFTDLPNNIASFLRDRGAYEKKLRAVAGVDLAPVLELRDNLTTAFPASFEDCVHWARQQYENNFVNKILTLQFTFPKDLKHDNGTPFWIGKQRYPHTLPFDPAELLHMQFVAHAAVLRAQIFGIPLPPDAVATPTTASADNGINLDYIRSLVATAKLAPFQVTKDEKLEQDLKSDPAAAPAAAPAPAASAISSSSSSSSSSSGSCSAPVTANLAEALALLAEIPDRSGAKVESLDFEKDDDSNHHVDFMSALANLRAMNFSIPTAPRLQVRALAGHIIPALATTTAFVSGLILAEVYKLARAPATPELRAAYGAPDVHKKLRAQYRNWFCNLAVNQINFANPGLARALGEGSPYSKWDESMCLRYTTMPTVGEVITRINEELAKSELGKDGDAILVSGKEGENEGILYDSSEPETSKENSDKPLLPLYEAVNTCVLPAGTRRLILHVFVRDYVEIPPVIVFVPPKE